MRGNTMSDGFTSVGTCRGIVYAVIPTMTMWAGIIAVVLHFR